MNTKERDWELDEEACDYSAGLQPQYECHRAHKDCLVERKRLAGLLTWKKGPPTSPGWYTFVLSANGLPYSEVFTEADLAGPTAREWLGNIVVHIGPFPGPPVDLGA